MTREELEKRLHVGVREDGTVESHVVETHLANIPAIWFPTQYQYAINHDNRFIAFVVNNGAINLEVRLPFELCEMFVEWIAKGKPTDDADPDPATDAA